MPGDSKKVGPRSIGIESSRRWGQFAAKQTRDLVVVFRCFFTAGRPDLEVLDCRPPKGQLLYTYIIENHGCICDDCEFFHLLIWMWREGRVNRNF